MKINFDQFLHALSDTIDLVGVDELQHGKRVAFMALECAKSIGETSPRQQTLYRAGLLHDCGVSSTKVHKSLVNELEWAESDTHCQVGAQRVMEFGPLAEYGEVIRYHHTRWENLRNLPLDAQVKDDANLIFLLDRVDALAAMAGSSNTLAVCGEIRDKIARLSGVYFKPDLVDCFLAASDQEAFWISQEPQHLTSYLKTRRSVDEDVFLDGDDIASMASLFSQIVDAKSPYTAEHSRGVARLARYLAKRFGLAEETCLKIELAGLLHDLGKLQVPDAILSYDGGLAGESLAIMRHHSYVSFIILNRIGGFEDITLWAANHHEKLDGSGYPFKRSTEELSTESRIVMIADIFQALAQERPYRRSLKTETILDILVDQAEKGKLDREIVGLVCSEAAQCHSQALQC